MPKTDTKELRAELRALRKEHMKPVSRMRINDVSSEIMRLRGMREETPAAAAVPSAPLKKSRAAVETVKEAKAAEFPVAPAPASAKASKTASSAGAAAAKKKSKLARLLEMMDSDDE